MGEFLFEGALVVQRGGSGINGEGGCFARDMPFKTGSALFMAAMYSPCGVNASRGNIT
jgi:hypothetical protein